MVSAEKVLSLVDALGGIVWEADPETFQFSFVSAGAERILGYPAREWLEPDFWRQHTHPEDVDRSAALCLEATREGRDHAFEYRMIAADGRVVWLRDVVSLRKAPDGAVTSLVGIALDITHEKEVQAATQRLSRRYEALLENSSDNIGLIGADGVSIYQSPVVERQLGYKPEEIVGRNNFDLVHPEDVATTAERFAAILASDGAVGPVRYRFRHKDGTWRTLETIGKRFVADDGAVLVVANTRDVTEVVEAQQALEETREQLSQSTKMEAVGRLAGGIAHDFNNLLTVVAGYADMLATTFDAADSRAGDVEEIKRAAHRATLLTRQLLTFSRKQVTRPEVLDLNVVVREVGVMISRLIGEDVQLSIETTAAPLLVRGDRLQLEQVLMNLAVNARDAMPLGGRLTVRTAGTNGTVRLSVSDTGSGMPPEVVGRMFEPFFTTKEPGKGTGLGLSTVYGIVQQAGGEIAVESNVGQGSVFTVALPAAAPAADAAPPDAEQMPRGTDTILVVQHEKQVRDLVEQVLSRLGYTVLVAGDAVAAFELCKSDRQRIALLIADMVMPHLSGPEIHARVAQIVPGVKVLYVSEDPGEPRDGRGPDPAAVLQKPFTPLALAQHVRAALDHV